MKNKKKKVLYVLFEYPQLSQTYIKNEIEAIAYDYEVEILSLNGVNVSYKSHFPYQKVDGMHDVLRKVREFSPDVMHTHWLNMMPFMNLLAKKTNVPYTVRAHSFDTLNNLTTFKQKLFNILGNLTTKPKFRGFSSQDIVQLTNSPLCLGVLCFPFVKPKLESMGIKSTKLVECYPVIARDRFFNKSNNGDRVMNVGACIPKKKMEDFVDLSKIVRDREFDLYSIGYNTHMVDAYNKSTGGRVNILSNVQPDEMPLEYKKHQWLVYTADRLSNTVGWPMAVAEAQAAGVGVCLPNIRPDLSDYLGKSGYLYNTLEEVSEIIKSDFPIDSRELGFEQSKKSDISYHKLLLTNLWDFSPHVL